jgi:hypothetical protein
MMLLRLTGSLEALLACGIARRAERRYHAMRITALLALLLASCAAERIGSRDSLRISASHYQSMAGVALKQDESPTTCKREMMTGSHIPRWYCWFGEDPVQYQLSREMVLDVR